MNHIGSPESDSWVFKKYIYGISKKGTHVRSVQMGGYAPDIAYNLSREKNPDLRAWLGRVGGVTDVRRK